MAEKKQSPLSRMGGRGIQIAGERAGDFKGTMVHLFQYLIVYKTSIDIMILSATRSSILSIVGSRIPGKATTRLFEGMIAWVIGIGLFTDF